MKLRKIKKKYTVDSLLQIPTKSRPQRPSTSVRVNDASNLLI